MSEEYVTITGDNELELYIRRSNRELLLHIDEIEDKNGSYHLLGFDGKLKGTIRHQFNDGWAFNGASDDGDRIRIGLPEDFTEALLEKAKEGDFMR